MTMNISPQIEARIAEVAHQRGVDTGELIESLIEINFPLVETPIQIPNLSFPPTGRAAAYLTARIQAEATDDPDEIQRAQAELNEMKDTLNAERRRSGAEPIF